MTAKRRAAEPRAGAPTIEEVYAAAAAGRPDRVDALLRRCPPAVRLADPVAIALRAVRAILGGDVPTGTALLRRSLEHADVVTRPYVADLLVPVLLNVGAVDEAEALLDGLPDAPVQPAASLRAARAIVAAHRGDDAESARLSAEALELAAEAESDVARARVLMRAALAAFYCEDFARTQDYALRGARTFERAGAHRYAANCYSMLVLIAQIVLGDPDIARLYATRLTSNAHLAGDASLEQTGLVTQLDVAVEAGDDRRVGSLRARLLAAGHVRQYREHLLFVVAEAMMHGWAGRFDTARMLLRTHAGDRASGADRAYCDALLALAELALGNVGEARALLRGAISRSAVHATPEPLYERHRRIVARIMAAAAAHLVGDPSRAKKALTASFDPEERYARALSGAGFDERGLPPLMVGYARFVNAAAAARRVAGEAPRLTHAEAEVLKALPGGATLAEIARRLGKARATVNRQVQSVYDKLEVSNRTEAVERARELGLIR